ncbi:hypothetical protein CN553_11930 [Bacillus cereus]|uniref:Uncharacterized protein n=1 Tax=Bacillus cereus TaxID=1396 RepID=A0A9X6YMH3_BACCE|nr:hypothetical protein [Bacillus cereus]PEN97755.1 hypothetical protein CN553_11930 [Bacillus cereus]
MEKWIGEKVNTTGAYIKTSCLELIERHRNSTKTKRLYKFKSRFHEEYYISDEEITEKIAEILERGNSAEIYEYLYGLIIEKFGVVDFILNVGHEIARERNNGYLEGKRQMRKDIKELLEI